VLPPVISKIKILISYSIPKLGLVQGEATNWIPLLNHLTCLQPPVRILDFSRKKFHKKIFVKNSTGAHYFLHLVMKANCTRSTRK